MKQRHKFPKKHPKKFTVRAEGCNFSSQNCAEHLCPFHPTTCSSTRAPNSQPALMDWAQKADLKSNFSSLINKKNPPAAFQLSSTCFSGSLLLTYAQLRQLSLGSTCKYIKLEWNFTQHLQNHCCCCCCCCLSLCALLLPAGSSQGMGRLWISILGRCSELGWSSKPWMWLEQDRPCGPCRSLGTEFPQKQSPKAKLAQDFQQ